MRNKPGQHLSQDGVVLARRVGQGMGPFNYVITSNIPRAIETAIAMGFVVDEQVELIGKLGDEVEAEAPWPQSFAGYAAGIRSKGGMAHYAQNLAEFYTQLAESLPEDGAALVINHGGIVEMGAVACLPDTGHAAWGAHCECCEGVRLFWDNGKFTDIEIKRIE